MEPTPVSFHGNLSAPVAPSCIAVVGDFLDKIAAHQSLNIFTEVFENYARAQAELVDQKIVSGTAGKLAGMVVAIKDNICFAGFSPSSGSKMLENFTAQHTSTALQRIIDQDAIIIGRTNCDEFGMGGSNETSAFGPTHNPLDPAKTPGGSSGGSAAAVAAGLCHAALGSDTGGSVRQPAAFCGVLGLKPSYSRVSRWGLVAYGSSFDQFGPIANTVEDLELLLLVMAGADPNDATCSGRAVEILPEKGKKIALLSDSFDEAVDPQLVTNFERLEKQFQGDGFEVTRVSLALNKYLVPVYYTLAMAEASSNLSRYTGVHQGYRSTEQNDIMALQTASRSEGFGKEVKRRIMMGNYVLSAGYYDAYCAQAQKIRRMLQNEIEALLAQHEFVLGPTAGGSAYKLNSNFKDPMRMYLEDQFTVLANLTGHPALSIPFGNSAEKMPFGLQILGPTFGELNILRFAQYLLQNKMDASV